MARARKSHKTHEEEAKPTRSGIRPAYRTNKPGANPYVVYVHKRDPDAEVGRIIVLSFGEYYSAKFFIDQLLDGDDYKWVDPIGSRACIKTDSGIRISMFGDDLEMILKYEPTELEKEWSDEQVKRQVFRFKYGRDPDREDVPNDTATPADTDEPQRRGKGNRKKDKREPKEPRVKIDKTGMISANDIAKELGVEGREVRGVLRALKLEKPAGGWLFDKKTADEIRAKVTKGLKEKKK